jgi:type VII secretion protein EccB
MWTQRDQLQAYQFLRRRLVSAVQAGDANHAVSPSRRLLWGCAAGTGLALLIAAVFGILGVLRPGANQDWRQPGKVVIERETGATFVYGADGLLHPALNYASARLLAGGDQAATVSVSARSLAVAPRGQPLGIVGAPTTLPAATALIRPSWMVCTRPAVDRPSAAAPGTVAIAGGSPSGRELGPGEMIVVRVAGDRQYVVTAGRRLLVRDARSLLAIGGDAAAALPVSLGWINTLPAGPDLALIAIPGQGQPGPRVGALSTKVGQVLLATGVGVGDRYYAVQADGLAPLTQTEAALILGNPGGAAAVRVSAADLADAPKSAMQPAPGYPPDVPRLVATAANPVLCLDSVAAHIWIAGALPLPPQAKPLPVGAAGSGPPVADEVFVPPGSGALVRDEPAPGAAQGTEYLVTDQGVRYPLGGADAARALGYGGVTPTPVPSTVLALLPVGPLLDLASARKVAAPAN